MNVNCEIMPNTDKELNDDFYVEDTDIMVTPSPKQIENLINIFICYMFIDEYKLMLWQYVLMIILKQIQFKTIWILEWKNLDTYKKCRIGKIIYRLTLVMIVTL